MMDDLLVKYLLQECSALEAAEVEAWIQASAPNQKRFDQLLWLWQESRHMAERSTVDVDAAWSRFVALRHANGGGGGETPVVPLNSRRRWLAIAAGVIILLLAGVLYKYLLQPVNVPMEVVMLQTVTTDGVFADTLPDGTIVTLNKHSRLQYPNRFADSTRQVVLEGEAFFDVAPNANQPFLIRVGDATIRVVGTSFNVRSRKGITRVVVETGIVEVKTRKASVQLHPAEQVLLHQGDSALQVQPVTDRLHQYYRSQVFVCDDTPLYTLVQALNEAYDVNIVIDNNAIRDMRITTTFNNEPLDTILHIVAETLGVQFVKEQNRILLR